MAARVNLNIYYSDGEIKDEAFETLLECLDYLKAEIVDKNEFEDKIKIKID